jgi:hypothetical protein
MPPVRRKKKVTYSTADALFAPSVLPPPPGLPKPDPANYDFARKTDCIAAFATLFDHKWPVEAVNMRVAELRQDLITYGWTSEQVETFISTAVLRSGWGFEGLDKKVKEKPASVPVIPPPEPPVVIDISGMLPAPKPARGANKPGLRGGVGK